MKITEEILERTADLAELALSGEEKENAKRDLDEMLALAEGMNAYDTEAIESWGVSPLPFQALREDEVRNTNGQERTMRNAPESTEDGFVVPKTISME